MKKIPCRHRGGFTLVEMMVALAVFAIIIILLASLITQIGSLWRSGRARVDNFTKARVCFDVLEEDLESAQIGRGLPGFENASGTTTLTFYCSQPGPGSSRPLSLVGYRVVDTGEDYNLGLQRGSLGFGLNPAMTPFLTPGTPFPAPVSVSVPNADYEVVGPGIVRMDFRFMSQDGKTISRTMSWNPALPTSSSATVTVCLLVIDADTLTLLNQTSTYAQFLQQFDAATSSVTDNEVPYGQWLAAVNTNSTFTGLPGKLRSALQVYERTISLSPPSP